MGIADAKSLIRFFYNRANMFVLTEIIVDQSEDEAVRKLAIKAGIDLLYKLDVQNVKAGLFLNALRNLSEFANVLRKLSENEKESTKLRNIANYIIEQIDLRRQEIYRLGCYSLFAFKQK